MTTQKKTVLFAFALAFAVYLAYVMRDTLLLIYVSVVFAVVLSPAVTWIERRSIGKWHPGRGSAIAILICATLALIGLFLTMALPPIIADLSAFIGNLPATLKELQTKAAGMPFADRLDFGSLQGMAASALGGITGSLSALAQAVSSILLAIILTAYFMLDGARTFNWALRLFPPSAEHRLRKALLRAAVGMRGWIVGQGMLMLVIGLSSAVVFGILGVRYFYALAVFAGVANIIPMLGPVIAVVLASLVAVIDSVGKLVGVLIFFGVYQQVENAWLTPRIMQSQVKLSAVAVLIALMIGGALAGIVGALVAVPTAVLISALLDEYVTQKAEVEVPEE